MLLVSPADLDGRRAAAAGPLAPLADSLAADLEPALVTPLYVPTEKALLSRAGGRCERDGAMLEFDPFSPRQHRCPQCGHVYSGDHHNRWWIYPYQLWLAERAVHASLLHALRGDERQARFARGILEKYCELYTTYPNRDNALGPTRPFFSTYLESIWLLQVCTAASFLEHTGDRALADDVRARIVQPSVALIAQYEEGLSNRQVWNNAAMMAAHVFLGDDRGARRIVRAASGVETHLSDCILDDGTWYEGENYHLFAHRGLWYCLALAERAGIEIAPDLVDRFSEGFATPFATALPDYTFPARKDSQYAVSLRQWRFAESCELGLARRDDARLCSALARLYAKDIPSGDTGRARSSAEAERNVPASRLSRADLGWRSLLFARPVLPELTAAPPKSAHLAAQGLTVFRRDSGNAYIALDWGQSGGGHGHPDRLNVMFAHGASRWLDDLGTASYVDKSLHWYRSTLAHNAPIVNGRSQQRVHGRVLAHDERGGVGWVFAEAEGIAPDVSVRRAIVVTPDYFVDEIRWIAPEPVRFELPIHFDGDAPGLAFTNATLDGGGATEDGFDFVRTPSAVSLAALTPVLLSSDAGAGARAFVCASWPSTLFRATAPGQPAIIDKRFYLVRCEGEAGVIRSVWAWGSRVTAVEFVDGGTEVTLGAEKHVHRLTPGYWQVEMTAGAARSGIELYGWAPPEDDATARRERARQKSPSPIHAPLQRGGPRVEWALGELNYRRSEQSWTEAGRPTAHVTARAMGDELVVVVEANVGPLVIVGPDAPNTLDNEQADINGHGVQVYVRTREDGGAWVVVPGMSTGTGPARARAITDWGSLVLLGAECKARADGFDMTVRIALPRGERTVSLDVLINETAHGRARRRGQLVLSGGLGEFVYLRGDRHDAGRLLPLLLED